MRILVFVCVALFSASSAFAQYSDYGYYSHNDEMTGYAILAVIMMILYIILSIIVLVRWWKMTTNVNAIRQHIIPPSPKLTYLIAIGEKEQAQKAALKMLVDLLYPIYCDRNNYSKAETMNKALESRLPKIAKLGLEIPDYVMSGEKFIDYLNGLTGGNVPYKTQNT